MAADLLVDTDVLVDHLRGAASFEPHDHHVAYSVVTRAELFAGERTNEDIVNRLLQPFRELPINREVAERAGRLRRETKVSLPDALIAATAIAHHLALLTRNTRDFQNVPGLVIV